VTIYGSAFLLTLRVVMAVDHRNPTRKRGSSGIDFATLIEITQARSVVKMIADK
jgi:hypothetical protein